MYCITNDPEKMSSETKSRGRILEQTQPLHNPSRKNVPIRNQRVAGQKKLRGRDTWCTTTRIGNGRNKRTLAATNSRPFSPETRTIWTTQTAKH